MLYAVVQRPAGRLEQREEHESSHGGLALQRALAGAPCPRLPVGACWMCEERWAAAERAESRLLGRCLCEHADSPTGLEFAQVGSPDDGNSQ